MSEVGSALTRLVLPLTAIIVIKATTFEVGLLSASATLAYVIVALPAGSVVDRGSKRRLMLICDFARIAIIGSIPLTAALGMLSIAQLYVVATLNGVFTVFFSVAYQSYLPVLVTRDQLMDCNGKLTTTQAVAQVAGPSIGGAFIGLIGVAQTLTIDAASYVMSALSLLGIRTPEPARSSGKMNALRLLADMRDGVRFWIHHPILRKIVICSGTANLFSAMTGALVVIFLIRIIHVQPRVVGLLIPLGSLGGMIGGMASKSLTRRIGSARIIWVSLLGFGSVGLLVPLAENDWRLAFFAIGYIGAGFSTVLYNVAVVTYRQVICPPGMLGRVTASIRWVVWGAMPFGGILGGALGAILGVHSTLWVAITGEWAAGFWVLFSPLRKMREASAEGDHESDTSGIRRRSEEEAHA